MLPLRQGGEIMSAQNYRYYCLDGTGQLHSAAWLEADNDEDAIAMIEARHPELLCEIWKNHRLVAKLSPKRLRA